MNKLIAALALVGTIAALPAAPAMATPGGCIKYGAAGAVAGHLVHHGVAGAVTGCAAGMYQRHKYNKSLREKAALYDKEHAGQGSMSQAQKASAYDQEQGPQSGATPAGAPPASPQ